MSRSSEFGVQSYEGEEAEEVAAPEEAEAKAAAAAEEEEEEAIEGKMPSGRKGETLAGKLPSPRKTPSPRRYTDSRASLVRLGVFR
jgi:hypothetical protein